MDFFYFIYIKLEIFERIPPKITLEYDIYKNKSIIFWNKKKNIKINMFDNYAIKKFKISLLDKKNKVILAKNRLKNKIKIINKEIFFPENGVIDAYVKELELVIEVEDKSYWNFLRGNKAKKNIKILIDTNPPTINIISHSYNITRGGSALVVFRAVDKNLKNIYIKINKKKFKVQKYKKNGYYVALIPWKFNLKEIKAKIIAIDYAGNSKIFRYSIS